MGWLTEESYGSTKAGWCAAHAGSRASVALTREYLRRSRWLRMIDQQRALPRNAESAPKTMVVVMSVCFVFLRSSTSSDSESLTALRREVSKSASSTSSLASTLLSATGSLESSLDEFEELPEAGKRILLSSSTKQYVESSSGVCEGVRILYGWRQARVPTFPEAK